VSSMSVQVGSIAGSTFAIGDNAVVNGGPGQDAEGIAVTGEDDS